MENVVYPDLLACDNHLPFCPYQNVTSWWLRKYPSSCKCPQTQALQLSMGRTQEHSRALYHVHIASADMDITWSISLAGATENASTVRWIVSFIKIAFVFLNVLNMSFNGPEEKKDSLAGRKRFAGSLSICTETEFKRLTPV